MSDPARRPKRRKKYNMMKEVWRRLKMNPVAIISLAVIIVFACVAVFADVIVDYELSFRMDAANRLMPPSAEHPFGTDAFGRDMFSRIIHGSRTSLTIGLYVSLVVLAVSTLLGAMCAYYGGWFDNVIMRICDVVMCIPGMLLTLALVAALGPGLRNMLVAISISSIPGATRSFRALMLNVIANEYINAAKAYGSRDLRIIYKHVLPNVSGFMVLAIVQSVPGMIMTAAGLSFLGMGIQPPYPEWGAMLMEGRDFMHTAPHLIFIPSVIMLFVTLSLNLLGDGLRDVLDPRLKN